jgi:hypothetical protein
MDAENYRTEADVILQVVGLDVATIRELEGKFMNISTTGRFAPHRLSDEQLETLQYRGIDAKVMCDMGVLPSLNSRALDLSQLADCYQGINKHKGLGI